MDMKKLVIGILIDMTNHYKHHPMFKFIISFGFIIVMNFQNTYRYELATHGRITLHAFSVSTLKDNKFLDDVGINNGSENPFTQIEERVWYLSRQTRLKESLWQIK